MKITDKELVKLADEARGRSYCPYSNYSVGAALLTKDGKVYTGANIENASFTPTVCAERVALFTAVHAGEREFEAIAIVGGKIGQAASSPATPCGVCRQVLSEFASPSLKVLVGAGDKILTFTLGELLPNSFGKESL